MSIIRGLGTYGSEAAPYEIAIFDSGENWCPHLLEGYDPDSEWNNDVLGYQTEADVTRYIRKVGALGQQYTQPPPASRGGVGGMIWALIQ